MSSDSSFETASLTTLHWVGIALAVVTGVVHLVIGIQYFGTLQSFSFVLAGVAFLVAVFLILVDYRRRLLYLVGIPFTAIQVVLYFPLNWPDVVSPIGLGDKAVQVALIAVLLVLYRRESP